MKSKKMIKAKMRVRKLKTKKLAKKLKTREKEARRKKMTTIPEKSEKKDSRILASLMKLQFQLTSIRPISKLNKIHPALQFPMISQL